MFERWCQSFFDKRQKQFSVGRAIQGGLGDHAMRGHWRDGAQHFPVPVRRLADYTPANAVLGHAYEARWWQRRIHSKKIQPVDRCLHELGKPSGAGLFCVGPVPLASIHGLFSRDSPRRQSVRDAAAG